MARGHASSMKITLYCFSILLAMGFTVFRDFTIASVVNTTAGNLRGILRELNGARYYLYAGIPYAEPPVGDLRFRAPVAKRAWQGILDATYYGPSCPQNISNVANFYPDYVVRIPAEAWNMSEDCLSLNVFVPADCSNSTGPGLPVMVWIHGGSYATGQGSGYDASALATTGEVVVVTINYRLNVFGFLCTNDDSAPGNFGLLDQQLALRWVHENVAAFGGDPSRVTLFGQSAGGSAVTLHLFAHGSRGLFQRVGAIGGYFEPSHAASGRVLLRFAKRVGRAANCPIGNTADLVRCLRGRTTDEILQAGLVLEAEEILPSIWMPTIDGHLLSSSRLFPNNASDLHHDLIISISTGDGSVILEVLPLLFPKNFNLSVDITDTQWASFLGYFWTTTLKQVAITFAYQRWDNDDFSRARELVNLMTDWNFLSDVQSAMEKYTTVRAAFMSVFDHRSSTNQRYPWLKLSPHSEDLSYIFGLPHNGSGIGSEFTEEEVALSERLITYWSNFAKSG